MIRIGLTQRVSDHFHGQPHDCLDMGWTELLLALDLKPVPLPNIESGDTAMGYLEDAGIDGLILTGGNDIADLGAVRGSQVSLRRDRFEKTAISWARSRSLPVFAVCRGLQMLNLSLGGSLTAVDGHAGTPHPVSRCETRLPLPLADMPDRFDVNSFHNFTIALEDLAPGLNSAAMDDEGHVEAVFHTSEPLCGIMWHPERPNAVSVFDRGMLTRFFSG